jgi:cellulose synthase/poly-beta-1,6-N-acetylglucosamine synthase-like glycosyltransferase
MTAQRAIRAGFWASAGWVAYTYAGFPILVALRGLLRHRPLASGKSLPSITVVVAAYNESATIVEKLENTLAMEYPPESLEVIVASDGSEDATNELVAQFGRGVRLLALPRLGKNGALTRAASDANGEILVFTDADTKLTERTLVHVAAPFADPDVGGVAGERRHGHESKPGRSAADQGKRLLRRLMSRAGNVTSAEGQIYAVRRELFQPVPENVLDDFWISTRVVAAHRRLVYEPEAASYPLVGATVVRRPFERKVRMNGPLFRAFWLRRELLNPAEYGFYSLQLISHKLLRRLLFVPLIGLAVTAPGLRWRGRVYRAAALAQGTFHGAALAGLLLRGSRLSRLPPLRAALRFDESNVAAAVALIQQLRGMRPRDDMWEPQRVELHRSVRR